MWNMSDTSAIDAMLARGLRRLLTRDIVGDNDRRLLEAVIAEAEGSRGPTTKLATKLASAKRSEALYEQAHAIVEKYLH